VTRGAAEFLGELAQLAGRPALADACARETVEALIIPPDRLRALLVAEAELGERTIHYVAAVFGVDDQEAAIRWPLMSCAATSPSR
jgi:CRP-like cAMP-binding protein